MAVGERELAAVDWPEGLVNSPTWKAQTVLHVPVIYDDLQIDLIILVIFQFTTLTRGHPKSSCCMNIWRIIPFSNWQYRPCEPIRLRFVAYPING